jgi:Flp pilus assembly protein TadG
MGREVEAMIAIHKPPTPTEKRRRGAVLVETVLCIPFLVVMLAGVIQYGMLLHAMTTCDQYAREGARETMEHWSDPAFNNTSSTTSGTFANFMSGIATSSNMPYSKVTTWIYIPTTGGVYSATGTTLTPISNSTCTSSCTSLASGEIFYVQVQYDMTQQYVFYGLVPGLPASWPYKARVAMVAV